MINGIRFKVCGLTSQKDAALAEGCGADYLGFIFYPKSPRYISIESYRSMMAHFSLKPKVAVMVEPTAADLAEFKTLGFDFYQIHHPHTTPLDTVASWSAAVSPEKLWLAPRVPPGEHLDPAMFALAGTFLFDTYRAGTYGGTGHVGDWATFKRLNKDYPRINWILAGGLTPQNVLAALAETGARIIDINSGVESVPGIKSAEKLKRLKEELNRYKSAPTKPPF